ncbi:MAG TPA: hypothetical protein VF444_20125 [Pseudonocardiaceae bacterium]
MLTAERKAAAKRAVAIITKLAAQGHVPASFRSDTPVVVALENEQFSDVLDRIISYRPPVVLAVYYPATDRIELLTIEPDRKPEGPDRERVARVHRNCTVGMVVDTGGYIATPGQWEEVLATHRLTLDGASA